mmetsp:Transcript_10261/g.15164  ORF Transcript_10261/g.15164 Transcript_10261/m.15164 type:complete len:104 (+) Transcript_10261:1897-2208(+)
MNEKKYCKKIFLKAMHIQKNEKHNWVFKKSWMEIAIMMRVRDDRKIEANHNFTWTTAGTASLFNSITTLIPSRSLSSLKSLIPSNFLSFTNVAIFSNSPALFT